MLSLNLIWLNKIRNLNIAWFYKIGRNKFEYQMSEIQNRLEHLNLNFLKLFRISDFVLRISSESGLGALEWTKIYKLMQLSNVISSL